jgi:S-adenosylmethionine decarboxylase proenzyme
MNLNGVQQVGVHVIVNVYNIPNIDDIRLLENGLPILDEIVSGLDLHVVARSGFQFTPIGYSYAYVLSESHFTIHTYPEHRSCYIDIFCCNAAFNAHRAIQLIRDKFNSNDVRTQIMVR